MSDEIRGTFRYYRIFSTLFKSNHSCFSGYQGNMSGPYSQNPYASNNNPQGGNPYAPSGYGMPGSNPGYPQSGYPPPPQQQQQYPPQYGNNPYGPPTTGGYGSGYPPQSNTNAYPPPNPGFPGAGGYPPAGGFPGAPGGFMPNDPRMQRLNQVVQQYEINRDFAARLQALGNCEIVVLCDDSGSMNTPLQGTNQTRWDELKSVCFSSCTTIFYLLFFSRSSIL